MKFNRISLPVVELRKALEDYDALVSGEQGSLTAAKFSN